MLTNCDFVLHHLQNLLETSGSIKASSLIFANICSNYLEIISVKSFPVRNKWLQGVSVGRDVKKYPKKVCNKGLRGGWHDPGKYRIITCFEAQTAIVNPVTERPAWHWGIHSFGNDCRLVHRPFWQKEVTGSQLRFHRTLTVRLTDLNPQNTNSTLIETKGGGGSGVEKTNTIWKLWIVSLCLRFWVKMSRWCVGMSTSLIRCLRGSIQRKLSVRTLKSDLGHILLSKLDPTE